MGGPKWEAEGELLGQIIDQRFDSRGEFATLLGVSDDIVSNWCRGITRLRGDRKAKVMKILNVTDEELRPPLMIAPPSRGRPFSPRHNRLPGVFNLGDDVPIAKVGFVHVPIFGAITAGEPGYTVTDVLEWHPMPEWGTAFERWGRIVVGSSMEPEFEDGDVVFFENRNYEDGHAVHAFSKDGEDTFKVYRKMQETPELWPINTAEYESFSAREWFVKGVVIERLRRGPKGIEDIRRYPHGYRHHFRM